MVCADSNLSSPTSKPEHGRPRGWVFLTFLVLASHGRTIRYSLFCCFHSNLLNSSFREQEEGGCRFKTAVHCLISRLDHCPGSVYCRIFNMKICVHLATHKRDKLLHPSCLEINLALLFSKFSVSFNHGSCTKGLFSWQTCYFTCCFCASCWGIWMRQC